MAGQLQRTSRGGLLPRMGFGSVSQLRDEMEDLFERFAGNGGEGFSSGMLSVPMDMSETEDQLQLRLDLPGVDPKNIDVQVNGNMLTISGSRQEEEEKSGETFHRIERRSGRFFRSVSLPCPVQEDQVDANYRDGVLNISVPKREEAKSRRIEVKSGE